VGTFAEDARVARKGRIEEKRSEEGKKAETMAIKDGLEKLKWT